MKKISVYILASILSISCLSACNNISTAQTSSSIDPEVSSSTLSATSGKIDISNEGYKKLSELNLDYNQYYNFITNDVPVFLSGYRLLTIDEFAGYYKYINTSLFPKNLLDKKLSFVAAESENVFNSVRIGTSTNGIPDSTLYNKIQTADLSKETPNKLQLVYTAKDNSAISVSVSRRSISGYNAKQVYIDGNLYNLVNTVYADGYSGFIYKKENFTFYVENGKIDDINGRSTFLPADNPLTEDEVTAIIKNIGFSPFNNAVKLLS